MAIRAARFHNWVPPKTAKGGILPMTDRPPAVHHDEIALRIGGRDVALTKSDRLIGIRPRDGGRRGEAAELAGVGADGASGRLADFDIVDVTAAAAPMEQTLDDLRENPDVDAGTHVFHTSDDGVPFVPTGEIFVEFTPDATPEQCTTLLVQSNLEIVESRDERSFLVQITKSSPNPLKVSQALLGSDLVSVAEPELATPGALADGLGGEIAEWLKRRGCPHFVRDSHPWNQAPDLLLMLILVSALEVGVWPHLGLPAFWLLVVPVPFILLARLLRKKFVEVVGPYVPSKKLRGGLVSLIILPALVFFAISLKIGSDRVSDQGLVQILAPEPWLKFGTLLGTFVAALLLFNRAVWRRSSLLKRIAVSVGVFATLIWVSGDGIVLSDSSRLTTLIGSLSGLVVLVLIMLIALGMGSAESDGREGRRWTPFAAVTILVIGVDASLPSDVEAGVDEIAGVVIILALLGLFWLLVYALTSHRNWSDVQLVEGAQALHPRSIAVWIAAFLFACPVWLMLAAWARSGGSWEWSAMWTGISGQHDAIWVLLINIGWLFVIWAIAIYRLPKIMKWAAKTTWKRLPLLFRDLMVGLPALILFTAFLMLTSDTWVVLSKAGDVQFWMAVGGLIVVSVAFLVTGARLKVAALDGFRNKAALLRALNSTEDDPDNIVERARASIEKDAGHAALAQSKVNKGARVNGILILVFFQVVVLTIVGVAAALVFWFVASQVVSEEAAADWISSYRSLEITPSTSARVVILMTAFATLYMSANIAVAGGPAHDDPESEAASFQDVADEDLAQRLALRRVHYALTGQAHCSPDLPIPGN